MDERNLNRRPHDRSSVEKLAEKYNNWDKWGEDDELGSANYVTPDTVLAASACIKRGDVFSLSLPFDRKGPQTGRTARVNPQHLMLLTAGEEQADDDGLVRFTDDAVYMPLQASTQWDALCHVFYNGKSYNGRGWDSVRARGGAVYNSITNLQDRAVGRGVLLDLPRATGRPWLEPGESIQDDDLERCAHSQGVEVGEGDFVLIRTGQIAMCRENGSWGSYAGGDAPGLGVDTANFLCNRRVTAVATDTWGVETRPYESTDIRAPLHVILLSAAGIYMGEMWDMEKLADDCARDGVYDFFVSAPPLMITGAVGSPINPIAIK